MYSSSKQKPNQTTKENSFSKTNVSLWKSKYNSNIEANNKQNEEVNSIENDYIENLKKQIYFMEMELKLMKEREKEIQKSGGFTQLFNDDRDPSQHILQLKTKYSQMRQKMETKIEELTQLKRNLTCENVSLKAKYDVLSGFARELNNRINQFESEGIEILQNYEREYKTKFQERNEIEGLNKAIEQEIVFSEKKNDELEYSLQSSLKEDELKERFFEEKMKMKEELNKIKTEEYIELDRKIKEINNVSDDPVLMIELDKNKDYKKRIASLERELVENEIRQEELEIQNEYLIKKKEEMIIEKKKLISLNEELKREIDQKNQLNELRILKKVKDNNSKEISDQEEVLKGLIKNVDDFERKINGEYEKIKVFSNEIIKLKHEISKRQVKKAKENEEIEEKYNIYDDLKSKSENLKEIHHELSERLMKDEMKNENLTRKNKVLKEEHASVTSKLKFILENFDFNSNLKRISVEDMAGLTQTNSLVNDSINNLINKVSSFKSTHVSTSGYGLYE